MDVNTDLISSIAIGDAKNAPCPDRIGYLLADLHCAAGLRVHLLANEIDEIGVALKFRMITAEDPLECSFVGAASFLDGGGHHDRAD
jgi:hypothetical protein